MVDSVFICTSIVPNRGGDSNPALKEFEIEFEISPLKVIDI